MDFDRGIVKALFYDYPVDALVALLDKNKNNLQQDVFLDILPQLVQWSKQEYTYTEANLLRIQTGGEWVKDITTLPTVYHPFDIIQKVAEKILTSENDLPVVDFRQLFRWKEAALYIGEDILTTAFVANYDLNRHRSMRSGLNWADIIPHNNHALNEVLDEGLADVHAHYYATADVFNLNWISLTNNIQMRKKLDKIKRSQEMDLLSSQTEYPSTLKQQCVAAAYLRFVFYCLLLKPQCANFSEKEFIENNYCCKVNKILTDPWFADSFALDLQAAVTNASLSSLPTTDRRHLDYCLLPSVEICELLLSDKQRKIVNVVYQGERQLLYKFFYGYYSHDLRCLSAAPYFYLYLLLKSKIRREFVQINPIKGFENFEEYQDRKDLFIPEWSPINKYFANIVEYTSTYSDNDILEPRVTPKNIVKEKYDYEKSMFGLPQCYVRETTKKKKQFDIVVHFIKNGRYETPFPTPFDKVGSIKDGTRDTKYRNQLKRQIFDVIREKDKKHVVGIDAASREIFCRPEVFGHVYRYATIKGVPYKTYHAGEDFLDIPDGIRAIEEAILFLDLNEQSRIGHAMALGINAKEYYERRHYTSVIPLQNLLDECVWLYVRGRALGVTMSHAFEDYLIKEIAQTLYNKIGYNKIAAWDTNSYWQSMMLRGNDPEYINSSNDYAWLSLWDATANSRNPIVLNATDNQVAKDLYSAYFFETEIVKNGMQLRQHVWKLKEISAVVEDMQEKMRHEISRQKIAIECCPTSNLKIGYIDRYDQHPLLTRFYPIYKVNSDPSYPLIKSSINTDDRGVFHTSVYEEYSLIALALEKSVDNNNKRKYNEPTILRYIEEIRENAHQMAFKRINEE